MAIERLKPGEKFYINTAWAIRTVGAATVCVIVFAIALRTSSPVAASFQTSAATAFTAQSALSEARLDEDKTVTALKLSKFLGKVDSGAARLVLMENALAETSRWGIGVDRAHALAPHNLYLFFAVAFGAMGIVVMVLIGSIGYFGRANLAFVLATAGAFMFTHDFTMLDLAVPIALGCAGAIYLDVNRRNPVI
jgi:hypothetical protein